MTGPRKPKYPRRCAECGKRSVHPAVIHYKGKQKLHDNRLIDFEVADLPITKCTECGEEYFGNDADALIQAKIAAMLNESLPFGRCHSCGNAMADRIVEYKTHAKDHDTGKEYPVVVERLPVLQCVSCEAQVLDSAAVDRVDEARANAISDK